MSSGPSRRLTDRSDRIAPASGVGQHAVAVGDDATPTVRVAEILEATCRVIARDGAHGLHMKAVADEAGVSKALVHYYFATRQELLRRAFVHAETQLDRVVDAQLGSLGTGAERVARALLISVESDSAFGERRALWNEVWSSVGFDDELRPLMRDWHEAWLARLVALVEDGKVDGSIPASVDSKAAAWRLGATADGVDSLLYLGILNRHGAAEMLKASLEREFR